ncbi:fatty acid desaturase [Mesorhizobium sp. M1A.T.Ca.IN.004.03.1.1]|uniref:fatty acid desaturase n=1 Tax=Mesorhizobium sp. M1A.T.Ca.IN.004.03.1.1 TaxID=2496795 RepID=UPI000FCA9C2D|nr:fatty acid desaturase [Mesorhizobium sp. M1A.T.Ca.IN.004.03.1.1]RUV40034.1 fatty acid desaturase [Mesorhizobium sp. M1A.T.Ca.IN.004.03.1.1]
MALTEETTSTAGTRLDEQGAASQTMQGELPYFLDTSRSPRETFDRFPNWLQPLITAVSGKPLRGQSPVFTVPPVGRLTIDLAKFAAGIGLAVTFLLMGGVWLLALPFAWILTVNGASSLKLISHYAAHACVTGNKRLDNWVGEVLTAFVLASNMDEYAHGHTMKHHGMEGIGTADDPDMGLLFMMGFETGREISWYKKRLLLSLISPRYHLLFLWDRLRSNFITGSTTRRLMAWSMHGVILGLVVWLGDLNVWFLAWFVPVGPLLAISIGLQVPAEHLWLSRRASNEAPRDFVRRISHGRFFLVAAPRRDLSWGEALLAWGYWSAAMLGPMLERGFVCVSVMPAHDFHHRHARIMEWPVEHYLRQHEIDRGASDYRDIYGNSAALGAFFATWSQLPRNFVPHHLTLLGACERRF